MRPVTLCATALTALLAVVPAARGAVLVSMDSSSGLSVVTQDADHAEDLRIIGRLNPERTIAAWDVESSGCVSVGFTCVQTQDTVSCTDQGFLSGRANCTRETAGVTVQLRGGDDNLDVYRAGSDRFSVDMGPGDDHVDTSGFEINAGEPPGGHTGPWSATLGTGDDTYQGSLGSDTVLGGDGNDSVDTLAGNDFVQGDAGADVITAGAGSDGVSAGSGNDVVHAGGEDERAESDGYDGGSGFDTLSYQSRTTPIFVAAIGTTGGASGENDAIAGFERVVGGAGNDSILGFSSQGGAGNDVLTGSSAGDTIVGGPGADILRGFAGDDTLNAKDGEPDTRIDCSTGNDTALLDLVDPAPTDPAACELIDRRKIDEEAGTQIRTSRARMRDGRVALRLRCPRAVGRACAGTLALAVRHTVAKHYRVAAGHSGRVVLTLGAADAARVRRHAGGLTAVATSREQGRKGPETVIRRIRVR